MVHNKSKLDSHKVVVSLWSQFDFSQQVCFTREGTSKKVDSDSCKPVKVDSITGSTVGKRKDQGH